METTSAQSVLYPILFRTSDGKRLFLWAFHFSNPIRAYHNSSKVVGPGKQRTRTCGIGPKPLLRERHYTGVWYQFDSMVLRLSCNLLKFLGLGRPL